MVVEIIQREVPTRGIGYIILRDCPEERLGEALNQFTGEHDAQQPAASPAPSQSLS